MGPPDPASAGAIGETLKPRDFSDASRPRPLKRPRLALLARLLGAHVLALRCRLDVAPHADRPPTLFGDAADELTDEGKLGPGQRKPKLAFDAEDRREFLPHE